MTDHETMPALSMADVAGKAAEQGGGDPAPARSAVRIGGESRALTMSSLIEAVRKDIEDRAANQSGQGESLNEIPHPFSMTAMKKFREANEHHASCLETKTQATVGLGFAAEQADGGEQPLVPKGFEETRVDEVLNPLCDFSWADTLVQATDDFFGTGNGYFECVRGDGGPVTAIYYVPCETVTMYVEDNGANFHYVVQGSDSEKHWPRFGDRENFISRRGSAADDNVSEIIHLRRPSNLHRWYGWPDWLAAITSIELAQMSTQQKFDFFYNRGVPELLLLFLGTGIDEKTWKTITDMMHATTGPGNGHKSAAVHLPQFSRDRGEVRVEKLGDTAKTEDEYASLQDNRAMAIISAHGVPPLLAGIQIPGKLGATNEMANAMMMFQTLRIGPAQRILQQRLGATLGSDAAGLGLSPKDFSFRRIIDAVHPQMLDTMGRMRTEAAASPDRDLTQGVRD